MPLALLLLLSAQASDWGPWEGRWAPVGEVQATPAPSPPRHGLFEWAYRLYRKASAKDTAGTCPYYPTCSGYAVLSVREHGPLLGGLLTVDRLLREYPGMANADHYPLVTPHATPRLHDPVPPRPARRDR